ncbi:MAG: diguanylate cyclase [Desulfobacteraceae bacterium IS3]|nr:MAG: diguanylate cyclase [Desulfobacteraceae bacterium IS3]
MKVAFPTQENIGFDSMVYSHFGSARFFIIVDEKTGDSETVENSDSNHIHGQCNPVGALGGKKVDAVVAGGIGGGALNKLTSAGIKVYRGVEGTISENLEMIKAGKLPGYSAGHICNHEHHNGGCAH